MTGDEWRVSGGITKNFYLAGAGVAAGLALFGAVAFACVVPSSSITNTKEANPMGSAGGSLLVSSWTTGNTLDNVRGYRLHYVDPEDCTTSAESCHHFTATVTL